LRTPTYRSTDCSAFRNPGRWVRHQASAGSPGRRGSVAEPPWPGPSPHLGPGDGPRTGATGPRQGRRRRHRGRAGAAL